MDEGTARRSAMAIAEQIESIGGYLSTQSGWDSLSASVSTLSQHLEPALELLAEITTTATYPEDELTRLRSHHLAELQKRLAQPSTLANNALIAKIYSDTVYGTALLGTPETVAAIDQQSVLEFAQRYVTPKGAAIILTGDLDVDAAVRATETTFGAWQAAAAPQPPEIDPPSLEGIEVHLIDRPGAPQTELRLGHIGVSRTDPNLPGLQVLNSLLGGKFTSRINLNLRERMGITYGASSSFAKRRGRGPFSVGASVSTPSAAAAVEEIRNEMRRLQAEPVSAEELADTKSYLLGVFPYTLQQIEGLADRLAELAVYDLPDDYFERYLDQLRDVTVGTVQRLARRYLEPDRLAVIAVGPRSELEDQLGRLGHIEIETSPEPEPPQLPDS